MGVPSGHVRILAEIERHHPRARLHQHLKSMSVGGTCKGEVMDKRVISLLVAVLLLSGAAAASAQPAEPTPTGVWEGVITGREWGTRRAAATSNTCGWW